MNEVRLKYSTTQPICSLKDGNDYTFFFFEDDQIPGELFDRRKGISGMWKVQNGVLVREKDGYFIDRIIPGKECIIKITKTNGAIVRLSR